MVTAALPYANGHLHVGHIAGAYLPADIYVRYRRAKKDEVLFVCGSDDNGVPIALTARKENKTPAEVVAFYNAAQKQAFDGLGINFNIYGGTHTPRDVERHNQFSQHFFLQAWNNGFLTKRKTRRLYDPQAQMFLPDRYVKGTCHHCGAAEAYGDQCENCGKTTDAELLINPVSVISGAKPEVRETTHWFFELEKFRPELKTWLASKTDWRSVVLNFTGGLLDQQLPARSITRDLEWGVPVPLDDPDASGKVLYVWFDAPIGYVSFTAQYCQQESGNWQDYERWWKNDDCPIIHFIGEDNTVFHAVIWPAMLMAEGTFRVPDYVIANCFLNIQFPGKNEEKISKSRGTAVWINDYLQQYDPDPLRYYLTAIAPETQRTTFSLEDFIKRNNEELVSALGNFFHRALSFVSRYFDEKVPDHGNLADIDKRHLALLAELPGRVGKLIEEFSFKAAQGELMSAARAANKYFDTKQPWSTRKTDAGDCGTTMNLCIQTLRTFTTVMQPFLPFAAEKAARMLNLETPRCFDWDRAAEPIPSGTPIGKPEILFKKIELDSLTGETGKT
jgi:methionyl-tRNA synthetase